MNAATPLQESPIGSRTAPASASDLFALTKTLLDGLLPSIKARIDTSFWPISKAIPSLAVTESNPETGAWYAQAEVGKTGCHIGLSVSIMIGEIRVGVVLPNELKLDRTEAARISHDGTKPSIIRTTPTATIFDWVQTEGVFSARWMLAACGIDAGNGDRQVIVDAIKQRLGNVAINLWKGVIAYVYETSGILENKYLFVCKDPINPQVFARHLPVSLESTYAHTNIGQIIEFRSNLNQVEMEAAIGKCGFQGHLTQYEGTAPAE